MDLGATSNEPPVYVTFRRYRGRESNTVPGPQEEKEQAKEKEKATRRASQWQSSWLVAGSRWESLAGGSREPCVQRQSSFRALTPGWVEIVSFQSVCGQDIAARI
jgi:hypothetical protein